MKAKKLVIRIEHFYEGKKLMGQYAHPETGKLIKLPLVDLYQNLSVLFSYYKSLPEKYMVELSTEVNNKCILHITCELHDLLIMQRYAPSMGFGMGLN